MLCLLDIFSSDVREIVLRQLVSVSSFTQTYATIFRVATTNKTFFTPETWENVVRGFLQVDGVEIERLFNVYVALDCIITTPDSNKPWKTIAKLHGVEHFKRMSHFTFFSAYDKLHAKQLLAEYSKSFPNTDQLIEYVNLSLPYWMGLEVVPTNRPDFATIAMGVFKKGYGLGLQYVPIDHAEYAALAKAAIKSNGNAIRYVSKYNRDYGALAMAAVEQNGSALRFVDTALPHYDKVAMLALKHDPDAQCSVL